MNTVEEIVQKIKRQLIFEKTAIISQGDITIYHKVMLNAVDFKGVGACAGQCIGEYCAALKISFFLGCGGIHM